MGAPPAGPPVLFFKPSTALVPNGGRVRLPVGGGPVHHEVELVVAIGKTGTAIPENRAMDHVLGYAVGLDLTLREVQARAKERGEPWCLSKGFDGSAPVSEIVPRDEVGDGSGLDIRLEVNGEIRQRGNTSQMMRTVPELIAFASRWITLERGDLLFTGTPAGVGPVQPGDHLVARIDTIGTLSIHIE
jgi:fumarylpyruvate hydrolase